MKIHLDSPGHAYVIQGYSPGEIRIRRPSESEEDRVVVCHGSLIITPGHLLTDWSPQRFDELTARDFDRLEELAPEIVLVGTGPRLHLPSPPLLVTLVRMRAGFEVMDTPAACRTYNLLVNEGRRVAAALLIG